MSADERLSYAKIALKHETEGETPLAPVCPFLSTLIPSAKCHKGGGVCSIRKYAQGPDGSGTTVTDDKVVTICPSRFLQHLKDDKSLFSWVSEKMLDISDPIIVKETPFLRKVSDRQLPPETEGDMEAEAAEEKKAGRIDWILVKPSTMDAAELEWCAVETQALYFSGGKMGTEFEPYLGSPPSVCFPVGKRRRPDYRSSGPKRLSPQLDVKVPALGKWGKKVAVVIDRFFYENMNTLEDAYPRARNDQERRHNADIAWFVVDYDDQLRLTGHAVVFTTLDSSRRALNATEPLSKGDFTKNLRQVIQSESHSNKVFRA